MAVEPETAEPETTGGASTGARSAEQIAALRAAMGRIGGTPETPGAHRRGSSGAGVDRHPADLEGGPSTADADDVDLAERLGVSRGSRKESPGETRDAESVARNIVLRQLQNSPKTRRQLRTALARRECPDEVAEHVLDRMTEVGLVDDRIYAEMYVRSKQERSGQSVRALRHGLRKKGVDDDTIAAVLNAVGDGDEEDRARRLAATRLARMAGLDRDVQFRRLAGLLARKGYPSGIAIRVIREVLDQAPEHQRD